MRAGSTFTPQQLHINGATLCPLHELTLPVARRSSASGTNFTGAGAGSANAVHTLRPNWLIMSVLRATAHCAVRCSSARAAQSYTSILSPQSR